MSEQDGELQITVEPEAEASHKEEAYDIEGLTDGEIELAKEQGFYKEEEKKDGEHEKQSETKPEENSNEKEEVEEPTFEDVEKDEKLIDKYNKNEKALYWKWKTDKQKRQEAQERAKSLEEKLKEAVDSGVSGKKLAKIKELLNNPDSLTIEALQEAIDAQIEPDKKPDEIDNAQVIQQKVATKAMFAEKIGQAKYENFDAISKLAKEIILADTSKMYQKIIDESFLNDDVDENMLVERVINIARLSPKFNEVVNQVKPEEKENIDRVLQNSKKKVSSASVNGASGRRIISESELTVKQAEKLSKEQWNKLKPETVKRLLMGIDP